jgi:hypothetical protein
MKAHAHAYLEGKDYGKAVGLRNDSVKANIFFSQKCHKN